MGRFSDSVPPPDEVSLEQHDTISAHYDKATYVAYQTPRQPKALRGRVQISPNTFTMFIDCNIIIKINATQSVY